MKKVLVSAFALAALTGCAGYYDYYKTDVRYTQDGADCVYTVGEHGRKFSDEISRIDADKKIVYRNTRCETLYGRDSVAAAAPKSACGCNKCANNNQPVARRRYVIVPTM